MAKPATTSQIVEQLDAHRIEFGDRLRDPASGFEGEVQSLYFFRHGCMRVELRGKNNTTGEPASFVFDAPELERVGTQEPVPAGSRRGGPHDLTPIARRGNAR